MPTDSSRMIIRDACPACGQSEARIVADLPFDSPPLSTYLKEFYGPYPRCDFSSLSGEQFRLAECDQCGCIYQNTVPTDLFLHRFYGEGLYGSPSSSVSPVQPYQVEQITRELMMVVRFLQPETPRPCVLDFGAGDGHVATLAAAVGLQSHASDLSAHAFPRLESRGINCHHPDKLPANLFDFINTEQVFEHLPRPINEITHLATALRPGGVLKIGVPHDPQLRKKLHHPDWTALKNSPNSLNAVAPIEHLNHFEPASLHALSRRAGLVPLFVFGWDLSVEPTPATAQNVRSRCAAWLRRRLGDYYQPYFKLTQTCFFQKPASPTP